MSFLFKENRIYNITVYFSKKYTCDKSHINVVYIDSVYDINHISKKDHFDINLGKDNKKFLNTLLYFILCKDNDIKFELVKLSKAYNQYNIEVIYAHHL